MTAIELYRSLVKSAHDFLEGTMADVPADLLTWDPPGRAFSIAANYAHVVVAEDLGIQRLLQGRDLLATTAWAGRTGLAELPPLSPGGDTKAWSRQNKIDVPALRQYAAAVYAATDAYLGSISPADLERPLDLSAYGFGQQPAVFMLGALLTNVSLHCGEISCLKGIQGRKGYPI